MNSVLWLRTFIGAKEETDEEQEEEEPEETKKKVNKNHINSFVCKLLIGYLLLFVSLYIV